MAQLKQELVRSFEGFSASTVEHEHVRLAKACISAGGYPFELLDFNSILERNEVREDPHRLSMLTSVFDFLLKYVINLLKPKRPSVWRSIRTNNNSFKTRVDCMVGALDVLKTIGYSVQTSDSVQFPEHVHEPDKNKLYVMAAELLMAKLEVEMMSKNSTSSLMEDRRRQSMDQTRGQYSRSNTLQMYGEASLEGDVNYSAEKSIPNNEYFGERRVNQNSLSRGTQSSMITGQGYDYPTLRPELNRENQRFNTTSPVKVGGNESSFPGGPAGYNSNSADRKQDLPVGTLTWGQERSSISPSISPRSQVTPPIPAPRKKRSSSSSSSSSNIVSPSSPSQLFQQDSGPPFHPSTPESNRSLPQGGTSPCLQKKYALMNSPGSSEELNIDPHSSDNSTSASTSKTTNSKYAAKDTSNLKEQLAALKKSRQEALQLCGGVTQSYTNPAKTLPSNVNMQRKSRTETKGTLPLASSDFDASIKRPPSRGNFQYQFLNDTIHETEENDTLSTNSLSLESLAKKKQGKTNLPHNLQNSRNENQPAFTVSICCNVELKPGHKFCPICGTRVNPVLARAGHTVSDSTPELRVDDSSKPPGVNTSITPIRASFEEASHIEKMHHSKLQGVLMSGSTQAFTPVYEEDSIWTSNTDKLKSNHELQEDAGLLHDATSGMSQLKAKEEAYKLHQLKESQKHGERLSSRPVDAKSGEDYLREKVEAFKASHRKKGVKEEDVEKMAEEEMKVQRLEEERKRKRQEPPPQPIKQLPSADYPVRMSQQPQERKNLHNYERKNLMENNYEKEDMEFKRMEGLETDGRNLLNAIKRCIPYGYSLGEIQLAFRFCKGNRRYRSALDYLNTEWITMNRRVCQAVAEARTASGKNVGMPTETEARAALVETDGVFNRAILKVLQTREEKINALLEKIKYMRRAENTIPELEWNDAVIALSRNGMDVDKTCYAIQTEWLYPVYEYIFSEYTKVTKTDMEEVKKIIGNEEQYTLEARHRLLMAEYKFKEKFRAEMVLSLIERVEKGNDVDYPLNYYVDAAKDFNDIDAASDFLNKECPICTATYPIHELVTMPGCTDSMCKDCFRNNFSIAIKERGVKHFNCPVCSLPDMAGDTTEDIYIPIFVAMIKEHLPEQYYSLCMEKLKDFNLTKEPGFIWCGNDCTSGFIYDADVPRLPRDIQCPNCRKRMCLKCQKPWEPQHNGLSCEQFAQWKQDNDPDIQKQGLAAHLNANGIECPQCHMRYDLARGGCMHFRCTRCPNEFCSGCGESFKNGQQCGKLKSCEKKGLHAHHPRDCLFYLRDFEVKALQDFLRENNVEFNVDPPKEQLEAAKKKKADKTKGKQRGAAEEDKLKLECCVMLQKELPEGLKDEECGKQVSDGNAGLCEVHYKEYLVSKINKNHLDPVTMYNTEKVKIILQREELVVPEINEDPDDDDEETEEEFRKRLIEHVKKVLPLPNKEPEPVQNLPIAQPVGQDIVVEDLEVPAE